MIYLWNKESQDIGLCMDTHIETRNNVVITHTSTVVAQVLLQHGADRTQHTAFAYIATLSGIYGDSTATLSGIYGDATARLRMHKCCNMGQTELSTLHLLIQPLYQASMEILLHVCACTLTSIRHYS